MSTLDNKLGSQAVPRTSYAIKSFGLLATVLVVGIVASTLPQPQSLGKLPLQNILKNQLHVKPSAMASFFLYCGLFWYIKPLAGILTDAFPLFGTRRRHYILFSAVLAAGMDGGGIRAAYVQLAARCGDRRQSVHGDDLDNHRRVPRRGPTNSARTSPIRITSRGAPW